MMKNGRSAGTSIALEHKPRNEWIADEIGRANVEVAADAYWHGWVNAMAAARRALAANGTPVPESTDALRAWLNEDTHRPRYRDTADVLVEETSR